MKLKFTGNLIDLIFNIIWVVFALYLTMNVNVWFCLLLLIQVNLGLKYEKNN